MHFEILIILSIISVIVSRGIEHSKDRMCNVLKIPSQKNFNLTKFQGKWYAAQKTTSEDSLLAYFMEIYDGRIIFTLNKEKNYDLRAYGSKFYGGWCPKGKGHALFPSRDEPEKMTMYFDTRIGRKIGMKPGWVLKTDYLNYAVMYSCWEILQESGICDPFNTYAIILQRKTKALTSHQQAEIDKALKSACVDPKKLKPVYHYGYCPNDVEIPE